MHSNIPDPYDTQNPLIKLQNHSELMVVIVNLEQELDVFKSTKPEEKESIAIATKHIEILEKIYIWSNKLWEELNQEKKANVKLLITNHQLKITDHLHQGELEKLVKTINYLDDEPKQLQRENI